MKQNVFKLNGGQLKEIALDLQNKIEKGLLTEDGEIKCIPTYIHPLTGRCRGSSDSARSGGYKLPRCSCKFFQWESKAVA